MENNFNKMKMFSRHKDMIHHVLVSYVNGFEDTHAKKKYLLCFPVHVATLIVMLWKLVYSSVAVLSAYPDLYLFYPS